MKNTLFKFIVSTLVVSNSVIAQGTIPEGARIKTDARANVYINIDNELRPFKNYSIVINTFNVPGDITIVSESEFQKFPIGELINELYLGKGKDAAVYLIINSQKRHIVSPEVFDKMGFNWSSIRTFNDKDLWKIQTGKPLKLTNTENTYEEPLPCGVQDNKKQ